MSGEERKSLRVVGAGTFSLLQEHLDYLAHLGGGNKSAGLRNLIRLAIDASEYKRIVLDAAVGLPDSDVSLCCLADLLGAMEQTDDPNTV